MDTQTQLAYADHHYDQNDLNHPGGAAEGEGEHHEKKSMFSRAKARAKRVKDSITNKAHGGQGRDQDEEDDEHDLDHEETVQDPQVLDAPDAKNSAMGLDVNSTGTSAGPTPAQAAPSAYDSVAPWDTSFDHDAKSGLKGNSGEKFKDTDAPQGTLGDKFGEDTDLVKHRQEHVSPTSHQAKISEPGTAAKTFAMASDANSTRASSGPTPTQAIDSNQNAPAPSAYDSVASWDTTFDHDAKSGLKGTLGEKFKDTNVPKGNLGDKFGEDTDLAKYQQEQVSPTSHQAKISEPVTGHITAHESVSPERHGENSGNLKSSLGIPVGEQLREADSLDTHKQQPREDVSPGNYQTKLTDTEANGGRDAGVSPILHSFDKMAINDDPQHQTEPLTTVGHDQSSVSRIPGRQTIPDSFDATTDKKHPQETSVEKSNIKQEGDTDKAGSGKDVIASKVDRDQNDDDVISENVDDAYVSALEPPKEQQSTHTEMLSSATDAVASKFDYGGTDSAQPVQGSEITQGDVSNVHSGSGDATVSGPEPPKSQSTYMGMVASKLGYGGTDNTPVQGSEISDEDGANVQSEYEMNKRDSTPAQSGSGVTGSAVLSKIPGIDVGTQQKTDEDADTGETDESTAGAATVGKTDKEKGMGEAEEKKGVHEAANDALHKRNTDENMDREKMDVPMGKVTESEEVANRLGSSEEERTGKADSGTGSESPSTGVVDRFKGAFTNWFGKGGETNPTMALNDQDKQSQGPTGEHDDMSLEAERRPQAN